MSMIVTSIKRQVKRSDRYSIYIDGKYSFSLGERELLQAGLRLRQELTEQELSNLRDSSTFGKLYDKTLNLLSYRQRSEWELRDYLRRKKTDQDTIEKILNRLSKNGYVNDREFARRWIENRRLLKPISKRKLRSELKQKRIPDEIIDELLASESADERDTLKELVARKSDRYPDKQKFMQFLARQGFNYDDIKSVLSELGI